MSKLNFLQLLLVTMLLGCTSEKSGENTIDQNLPSITTLEATMISGTSARSGGEITEQGTSPITTKGVCWSTTQNPTTNHNKTINTDTSTPFISDLTDLESETTYFIRSYAINASGTAYGNEVTFTTDLPQATAPCSPAKNTMKHQGTTMTFNDLSAGKNYAYYGNYGVFASGLQGDLRVDFNHEPKTGLYTIVSDFSLNQTLNECMLSATIAQGALNPWCRSKPSVGDSVYVTKLADHSYSITFCDIEFSCVVGFNSYNFSTDGFITD